MAEGQRDLKTCLMAGLAIGDGVEDMQQLAEDIGELPGSGGVPHPVVAGTWRLLDAYVDYLDPFVHDAGSCGLEPLAVEHWLDVVVAIEKRDVRSTREHLTLLGDIV